MNNDPQKGPVERPEPAMKEWIEKMTYTLGIKFPKKDPYLDCEIFYENGSKEILLHSSFTIEQLEALINHMREYQK